MRASACSSLSSVPHGAQLTVSLSGDALFSGVPGTYVRIETTHQGYPVYMRAKADHEHDEDVGDFHTHSDEELHYHSDSFLYRYGDSWKTGHDFLFAGLDGLADGPCPEERSHLTASNPTSMCAP